MNSRILMTLGVLVALVLFAGETFAGRGNGGGKPGGGGDPEPTPPGTIYFHPVGLGAHTMDADGGNKAASLIGGYSPPTYALHGGARFVATIRSNKSALVARRDDATEFTLWSEVGAEIGGRRAWAKDDSFIGFRVDRPASGTSEVVRLFVDWSSGTPVAGALEVVLPDDSAVEYLQFDWSPAGDEIVYVDDVQSDVWVKDLSSGVTRLLVSPGRQPEWSPDGGTIAFDWGGIKTIAPDGTGLVTLSSTNTFGNTSWPRFSPDSQHVVFVKVITTGKGKKASTQAEAVRIPAGGGSAVVLTGDVDAEVDRITGWR